MSKLFQVEIISPSGHLFNGVCDIATVPATNGEMGIMDCHEAILTSLKGGEITVRNNTQNILEKFTITGGFAQVVNSKLLILVN